MRTNESSSCLLSQLSFSPLSVSTTTTTTTTTLSQVLRVLDNMTVKVQAPLTSKAFKSNAQASVSHVRGGGKGGGEGGGGGGRGCVSVSVWW